MRNETGLRLQKHHLTVSVHKDHQNWLAKYSTIKVGESPSSYGQDKLCCQPSLLLRPPKRRRIAKRLLTSLLGGSNFVPSFETGLEFALYPRCEASPHREILIDGPFLVSYKQVLDFMVAHGFAMSYLLQHQIFHAELFRRIWFNA